MYSSGLFHSMHSYHFPADAYSDRFSVTINEAMVGVTQTPGISAAEREAIAAWYRTLPAYCHVDARFLALHYVHAACAGPAEVTVTSAVPFRTCTVYPSRQGIRAEVNTREQTATFTVPEARPCYLVLDFGEGPLLFLILEAPEGTRPKAGDAGVVDARPFLTDPTGEVDQTAALLQAIAAVNGTGQTLLLPPGVYRTDTLRLHGVHDCTLYFAPGCLLRIPAGAAGEHRHVHGLWLHACHDLRIAGRGYLDHQAYAHFAGQRNDYQHGYQGYEVANADCPYLTQSPLFITASQRITVEGLTVRDGRNFNVNIKGCDAITLRGCKILTPPASVPEWTDGYNICSSRQVLVEDCFCACNDDGFAAGHYFAGYDARDAGDCTVRGLVSWNPRANGFRLGFLTTFDQGDFTFARCDFLGNRCAGVLIHGLQEANGATPSFGAVRLTDCVFDGIGQPLERAIEVSAPGMERLMLDRVTFNADLTHPSIIHGHPTYGIGRLEMREVSLHGRPCTSLEACGIDCRHVQEVVIDGG